MAAHARNGPIFWSYFKRSDVLVHMCTSGLQLLGFAMSDRHFLYEIHTAFHRYGIGRAAVKVLQTTERLTALVHVWRTCALIMVRQFCGRSSSFNLMLSLVEVSFKLSLGAHLGLATGSVFILAGDGK